MVNFSPFHPNVISQVTSMAVMFYMSTLLICTVLTNFKSIFFTPLYTRGNTIQMRNPEDHITGDVLLCACASLPTSLSLNSRM